MGATVDLNMGRPSTYKTRFGNSCRKKVGRPGNLNMWRIGTRGSEAFKKTRSWHLNETKVKASKKAEAEASKRIQVAVKCLACLLNAPLSQPGID